MIVCAKFPHATSQTPPPPRYFRPGPKWWTDQLTDTAITRAMLLANENEFITRSEVYRFFCQIGTGYQQIP